MSYIVKYNITERKLSQQFIDLATISLSHEGYAVWLRESAQRLAQVGNESLAELNPSAYAPVRDAA